MGRVRNIGSECNHILLSGIPQNVPTTQEEIHKDFIIKRNNEIVPPLLERIQYEYDDQLNVTVIRNDDYRVTMHNARTANLSIKNPFSRFYFMIGAQSQVFIRKSLPSTVFAVHLDTLAKDIKTSEFQAIINTEYSDSYLTMEPCEKRLMIEKKHDMIKQIGLHTN